MTNKKTPTRPKKNEWGLAANILHGRDIASLEKAEATKTTDVLLRTRSLPTIEIDLRSVLDVRGAHL